MSFSRRKFLRAGTLLAVTAGLPVKNLIAAPRNAELELDLSPIDKRLLLSRETFARQLNTTFSFDHAKIAPTTLRLVEVNDLTPSAARRSAAATGKECFVAVFVGSDAEPLPQETYMVKHSSLGKFEMFVVPVGKSRKGLRYEAVFNRLH